VSGPVDLVTDGTEVVRIGGGDALLTRVTGGGCSLGAGMAAFLGVCRPLDAAVAASALYAAASERAAARASGPGSFAVALLDALDAVQPADLDGRTVVHVSQGTVANSDPTELIIPTLQALADEDVLVVVSTGGRPVESLGILPANARAAEYLPYDKLFPKLSVFVTNGGYGGLHFALQHGVPIVASGTSEDKLETNARVRWSGTGVSLRTQRPTPARIRKGVRRVLDDARYRTRAAEFGAAIDASPGLPAIDRAIEDLVSVSRSA